MRIDWDTPISELMHSESDGTDAIYYIDLDEDEMMHWKYIKKEKLPNGKWRYYYTQSELDAAKKEADKLADQAFKESARMFTKEAIYDRARRKAYNKPATPELYRAAGEYEVARYNYEKTYKKAQRAIKKYNTMKVTSFVERTISKGIVAVANFFSNLFGKKSKPAPKPQLKIKKR